MAKFYCDIVGLEDNWIDFADKWTRGEVKRVEAGKWESDEEFFEFLVSKVKAMHIVNEAGDIAASVDDLTDDFLDECDARLAGFVGSAPLWAVRGLTQLGNWSARRWSDTSETKTGQASPTR